MSSSNKMTLTKLCKQHYHMLPVTNHIYRYLLPRCLLPRCLSSVFTTRFTRKTKQSIAFGLLLLASALTTPVSAQTVVNICDRTTQVEEAILTAISPRPACTAVTATQLAAITELDLSNMSITALQAGDFDDLTGLTTLRLQGNTFTTPLPANLAVDLPSDVLIEIDLTPIDFAVALDTSGMITIDLSDAFISRDDMGDGRTLSYSAIMSANTTVATVTNTGSMVTVTATGNGATTVSVTADDGVGNVMRTISVTVEMGMSICDRTDQVETAILAAIPSTSDCNLVTAEQLANIDRLGLAGASISTLQANDFAGLSGLTFLSLYNNSLSTLPAGVFDDLTNLIELDFDTNNLSILPADVFDNLMNLTFLYFDTNNLSVLPANIFDNLTNLTELSLLENNLTSLPADVFDMLSNLTVLDLSSNSLSALNAGVFDNLTNLAALGLSSNSLSALNADVFNNLTNLVGLGLDGNNLSILPAGLFSGLINLGILLLHDNTFTTPLPANLFDMLPFTAVIRIDLSPIDDLLGVTLPVGGTATINVANAFISIDIDGTDRTLNYTLTPANTAVATTTESSGVVTITGAGMGTTTVNVTANDGVRTRTRDIAVTVVETGILAFDEATGDTLATPVVAEASGTDTVYVQLASQPASDVTLSVASDDTNEGTVLPATLTFSTANWATRQALTVTAIPDDIDRDDSFTVDFGIVTAADGDGVNYTDSLELYSVTVTITDDDTAGIDAYDMATGGNEISAITTSGAGDTATFYVELTSEPTGTVTVTIDGIDTTKHTLTTPASGTLTFDSTNWNNPRQAITITGVDGSQTYNITLTASGGGYDGVVEMGPVTNIDTVALSIADTRVNEDDGTATVTVTLTPAVTAGTVTVDATTMDGTAEAGEDYTAITSQTLTFTAGSTSETLDILINDDDIVEGNETFTVMLGGFVVPTGVTIVTDDTATVTITDDDTVVNICSRTAQVQTAILAAIFAISDCMDVTATHLAGITDTLHLPNMGITTLQSGDFAGLTSLTTLNLFNNDLTTIEANAFSGLTSLTTLNLIGNNLTTIEANTFSGLTSLTSLNLGGNDLTTIEAGAFSALTSLTTLGLGGNDLTTIEADTFSGLTSLATLGLNDSGLTTLEANTFSALTSLTFLDLDNNDLTTIEANTFSGLTSLAELYLNSNNLSTIEANTFSGLTSLDTLSLDSNDLTTIEADTFSALTSLTELDLFNNDLTALPAGVFNNLTNLAELDLSFNDLTTIEANTFSGLTSLTRLRLDDNLLTTIEANAFSGLTSLDDLNLGSNDLTTIEANAFSGLTRLTTLHLDENDLTTIEAGAFSGLTSLIRLFLRDNDLTALTDGLFTGLTSLDFLLLQNNAFTTRLPADIFDPVSSADITIDLSPIGDLPDVALTVGGTTTINVRNAFISRDFDGNDRTITYTLTPADTAVATVTETSGVVTITGAGMGTTTVSVTADDNNDRTFSRNMFTRDIAVMVAEAGILAFDEATGDTLATPVVAENNGTDTFYVQLASAPASDVTMTVMSSAIAEGTVTPSELTFTASDWNTRQAVTVTAVPDDIDRDDSFMVNFAVTSGTGNYDPVTLTTLPSVTVTVADDDVAGIDAYDMATGGSEITAITTSEGGDTATFYIELASEPTADVTLTASGIDPTEHTLTTPDTLTFTTTNWFTRQAVTFEGVDDDDVDGDQTYDVTLRATGGGYDGIVAIGSVTNTDDDTAALSIADMSVDENAGTATLTVTLTPAVTAGDVTVDGTTTDATAEAGTDYTALTSETLTFTAGTTSVTQDIPINDDNIAEGDETFTVMLDNLMLPTGITTVSISDATAIVTITDDDVTPTSITLSVSPSTVADTADATEITVTATLDGTVVLPTETVITVSVGGGTATEGTDYATVADFTLTLPAEMTSATGTFMIDPDTVATNGETIMITGTAGGFTFTSDTLTILEAGISTHDAITAGNPISTITIDNEAGGTNMFYVQLVSAPASNVVLSVTSSDTNEGTVTPPTLTFTAGNWSTRQPVTVTAVNDNVDRDDTFMVDFEIMSGTGNYDPTTLTTLPSVAVTVTDDDTAGIDGYDMATGGDEVDVTTSEAGDMGTAYVELASEPTGTVTVTISGLDTTEHTLTTPASGNLTFDSTNWNTPRQLVTLTGVDDNDVDGDQAYDITLTATGGGYDGVVRTGSVTNTDDDTATLSIADTAVNENAGTATLTVTLSAPVTAGTVTVDATTADGTATIVGADYTAITSQTLTFTAGSTSETLTITINDDNIAEIDEAFTVMLDNLLQPTGVTTVSIADSTAIVTITDNDTAGIAVFDGATGNAAADVTTSEGATTDTFYVALESQPTDTVTVTVTSGDPSEGTITTGASLTFTAADWNSRQAVTVTGQNDDDVDGDQTYDVTLTASGGDYAGVTAETVSITNTNDDRAELIISDLLISVNENAGMATVTVTLSAPVTAGDITVELTTADGTAEAGEDYTALTSETLTITAGSTSETLDIPINDDNIAEGDETFTVTLSGVTVPAAVVSDVGPSDNATTITITDDDVTPTGITLSVNPLTVADTADATEITVTATLDGTAVLPTDTVVTVSVGDVSDSATEGTDYTTIADFTLTIPALMTSATQTFMIDPNTSSTNGDMVTISGTAPGFTTVNSATLTIVEAGILVYDAMTLGNPISTATIAEASSDTFYVELASEPASNVTLSVTSSNENEGTVTPATLTFTTMNWNTRQALTVTAVDDNIALRDDTFMVDFMVMSGDGANYTSSLTLPSVAVTVSDDDTASDTINLSISPPTVAETAGATTITVTAALDGALSTMDTEVTVTVGGTGDTADEGSDYMEIPDFILTIPALMTSGSGTFSITPIADNENDNEETITISGTATINSNPVTVNTATLTITGFSEEEQQVIEQTVAAQASSVTQVVSENIGSFLASRTSAPSSAPSPPAPDGGGGDVNRENFTNIDWQDWQERFAKLAYEGLKRMDSGADMSLDWALKAAGSDGRLLMPLSIESLTLWAAGGRLKTKGDGMGEYDGGVNSFVVGVDTNLINNWLLGMAASYSDSQVDYTMDGAPIGTTAQNLYSVHPFLSHRLPDHGLTLWVTGGYGVGDIDFSHTTNGEASSDVTQWMAAGGIEKHIITNTLWQGALRLKGLWGNATVDSTEYDNGVDIRKVESTFWRARMESEMGYNFQLPGANIRPYALIGGRWDHNDAIVSGDEWHIDIGGGVEVLSGNAFALNISLHTQVTDGDTEEDSIVGTGSLTYDIGQDRQGLQITLSRPLNNTSPAWDQHSFNEVTDKVSGVNSAPLTSELAYGWTVRPFALEGALQTYVQNSFDSHDRHYAVGLELVVNALTLNFETGYGEADNTGLESLFKTKIRW